VRTPAATVCIVTRNRCEEVLRAAASAAEQAGDVEVLVIDDGSNDGSADAIAATLPQIRLIRHEHSSGYIVRRNEAADLASAPILVNLDDDAEFTSRDVVAQTVAAFDEARVGAVAIPLIDLPRGDQVRQHAPAEGTFVTQQFMGTAGAVRLGAFRAVGRYPTVLRHQSEESDLCLRLLAAGYVVRLGRGDAVRHYGSPKRDVRRMWFYGCRNDIVFGWRNVPMPDLVGYWLKTALFQLWLGLGVREPLLFARGVAAGFAMVSSGLERRPVSPRIYRLYRRLGEQSLPLPEVEPELPPVRAT
jgi:glycosyltransferase involved in cell wall biosynthesis